MKAIEILEWICAESINGEELNLVDVPEEGEESWEQNEEWWVNTFGMYPPEPIPAGKYLYFYQNRDSCEPITYNGKTWAVYEPDAEIELKPFEEYIYLYRIEE